MSYQHRNGVFVPRALGTAYAPAAEGESEGDYGFPVRERAAHMGQSSEALRVEQEAVESAERGMAGRNVMISDGRRAVEGKNLFEEDIQEERWTRMRGLREDDAAVRLGTAYAPAAEGESEGDYGFPVRERAAHMGTAYYPSAEGEAEGDYAYRPGQQAVHGLREDDARIVLRGLREDDAAILLKGLREEDAAIVLRGLREDDAAIVLRGLREDDAAISLKGLREDDAQVLLRGLREEDADIMLRGLREDDAAVRMGQYSDESNVELEGGLGRRGFRRPWKAHAKFHPKFSPLRKGRSLKGEAIETKGHVAFIGAEDFHPRFPVDLKIQGLGVVRTQVQMGTHELGIWPFSKGLPSTSEYLARLAQLKTAWAPVRRDLMALNVQQRGAIEKSMVNMRAETGDYDRATTAYIAEGAAGMTSSRVSRLGRLETALPSIRKLIDQAMTFGPAKTPAEEQKRVDEAAKKDVKEREAGTPKADIMDVVVPVVAGAAGVGLLTTALLLLL